MSILLRKLTINRRCSFIRCKQQTSSVNRFGAIPALARVLDTENLLIFTGVLNAKYIKMDVRTMRNQLYEMVDTGGDDKPSIIYDTSMMIVIIASLVPLCFKSQSAFLVWLDRVSVGIFIIDYIFRWITADYKFPKLKGRAFAIYPFTAWAIVDLCAILPSITMLSPSFRLFKILRLLRTFRVLKFLRYSNSTKVIVGVLRKEKEPLLAVCYLALGYIFVTALIMFSVEPETFNNFFDALYWATTALTTVGYGDIYPKTDIGRLVSMVSSLAGIAVVALPAGIITAGYMTAIRESKAQEVKSNCENAYSEHD